MDKKKVSLEEKTRDEDAENFLNLLASDIRSAETSSQKNEPSTTRKAHPIIDCFEQYGVHLESGTLPGEDTNEEKMISFSEKVEPIYFLVAMGYTYDKASKLVKSKEFNGRLKTAIKEARAWVSKLYKTRGQLIITLATKSNNQVKRYHPYLVEAIVNRRINSEAELYEYLEVLEGIEDGTTTMNSLLGVGHKISQDMSEEEIRKNHVRKLFLRLYELSCAKAEEAGLGELGFETVNLLHFLANRYKPSLYEHIPLLTQYIGQHIIVNETQLEGAVVYLSTMRWEKLNMHDFHAFCGISEN